jgi:membrane protein YqaA with SNARE-associated domain
MHTGEDQHGAGKTGGAGATPAGAWLQRVVHARYAQLALFWFAFLEATALPIPVEAVMVPYMQMRRDIIWRIALIALAGFMCSALLGYAVGSLLFDTVGERFLVWMGWTGSFEMVQARLAANGFWAMLAVGLTPLPTQVVMIGAGSINVPLEQFIAAIVVARSLRYFGVGLLVHLYGDRVVDWFARRRTPGGSDAE